MIQEGRLEEYDQLNVDFHHRVTELSDSEILISEVQRTYRFPFASPSAFPTRLDDVKRFEATLVVGQYHHQQVFEAIKESAGARAFSIMYEHSRLAHQNVTAAVNTRESSPQLALVRNTH